MFTVLEMSKTSRPKAEPKYVTYDYFQQQLKSIDNATKQYTRNYINNTVSAIQSNVVNYSALSNQSKSLTDGVRTIDFDSITQSIQFRTNINQTTTPIKIHPITNTINNVSKINFNDNSTITGITSDSSNTDPTKAISANILTDLNSRFTTLEDKTQNQTATENETTFTGNVTADTFNGYNLGMNNSFYKLPAIPVIRDDLVMEVGRYIDFHCNASTGVDNTSRLYISKLGTLHYDHSFIVDGGDIKARNCISDNGNLHDAINKIAALESKNTEQDTRLDNLESKDIAHEERMGSIEAMDTAQNETISNINTKNDEQDTRLDTLETKNTEQDTRLDTLDRKDLEQDTRLDTLETKNTEQDTRLDTLDRKDLEQDTRLDTLETKNTEQDTQLTNIETKNTEQDTRLTNIETKNTEQDTRLDTLETKNTEQDTQLTNIETKNTEQDTRLNTIETKNTEQDTQLSAIETKNTEQDTRLDTLETTTIPSITQNISNLQKADGILHEESVRYYDYSREHIEEIENTKIPAINTKNNEQDSRLTNIETKNTEQDEKLDNIINDVEKDINDRTLSLAINVEREGDVFEYPIAAEYKFQLNPISDDIYLKVNSVSNLYTTLYWAVPDESGVPHGQANEEIHISYDGTNVSISANVLNSAIEIPQPAFDIATKTLTVPRPSNYILLSYSNDDTTLKNFYCYHSYAIATTFSNNIIDLIYPIGSIYLTFNQSPPLFGTWELLEEGRFLRSTTTESGGVGGSSTHTHTTADHKLTINEMPAHNHIFRGPNNINGNPDGQKDTNGSSTSSGYRYWRGMPLKDYYSNLPGSEPAIFDTGGDNPHNHGDTGPADNIPPYITCRMYKRTA